VHITHSGRHVVLGDRNLADKALQSFEGGIADSAYHEPHAGYTFCSLGCLAFLDRLNLEHDTDASLIAAPRRPRDVIRWLVQLQTDLTDPDGLGDYEMNAAKSPMANASSEPKAKYLDSVSSVDDDLHQSPDKSTMWLPDVAIISAPDTGILPPIADESLLAAGFSGRLNKIADTCYAFWVGASLHLMQQPDIYTHNLLRSYLLELTQHQIMGGFTKFPGDKYADLYHSYLGLAALSLASTAEQRQLDGIKELDPGMCISKEARARLQTVWQGFDEDA